jgi:lysophospholipase L1-like esterase
MKTALLFLLSLSAFCTQISDTIKTPAGDLWSGKIVVDCPNGEDASGNTIKRTPKTYNVAAGVFSATLDPGDAGAPTGRSCTATYYPSAGRSWSETWLVPTSASPVKISAVQTGTPPPVSVMILQSQVTGLQTALDGKVDADDARLSDARTPTVHAHAGVYEPVDANIVRKDASGSVTIGTTLLGSGGVSVGTSTVSLRQVTNRTGLPTNFSSSFHSALARAAEISYVPLSQIKIGWANWYVTAGTETILGANSTVKFYVEYPRGTYTTVTWGGAASGTVADGTTGYTDTFTLGFTIPALCRFWVWTYVENTAGIPYIGTWANAANYSAGEGMQLSAGDTPGTLSPGSQQNMILPAVVLGLSNKHVVGVIGDSLTSGANDAIADASDGVGFFGRALSSVGPWLNVGCSADQTQYFASSKSTLRRALMATAGVDIAINALGVNDFYLGSRTSAQVLADRETIRGYFTFPVFDTTITPETTSTDNWATAANQTVLTGNTNRATFNAAQRAGVATSPGLIDIAAWIETSTSNPLGPVLNGGVWIPGTMDAAGTGVHPSSAGYGNAAIFRQIQSVVLQRMNQTK